MAIPVVGDGEYLGAGNTNETLRIGKSTQAVVVGDSTGAVTIGGSGAATVTIGAAATATIGFYGKTPVVRRTFSSAVHVTTNVTTSASFGTSQLAVLNELQNTMIGLGIWATS
jgi:hypothetical protein